MEADTPSPPTIARAGQGKSKIRSPSGDGRLEMTNKAAERAIRPLALGRKNYLFAGSDAGGRRAATLYTLIGTARLNSLGPDAWLADVIERIVDHPASRIGELPLWNRRNVADHRQAA